MLSFHVSLPSSCHCLYTWFFWPGYRGNKASSVQIPSQQSVDTLSLIYIMKSAFKAPQTKHFSIPSLICYGCLKPSCYNSVGCLVPVFSLAIVRDASVSLFLRGQKWPSGPDATALHVKEHEFQREVEVCACLSACLHLFLSCDVRKAHAWSRIVVSRSSYRLHWSVQRRARHRGNNVWCITVDQISLKIRNRIGYNQWNT